MAPQKAIETFYPTSRKAWRQWLHKNHATTESVWLLMYRKEAGKPTLSWSEAVDEALCFGWIDSKRKPIDGEQFMQFFSKRKPRGTWSKINKEKIQQLIDKGLMHQAGLDMIATAKQNGAWVILDEVEALTIPKDLAKAFTAHPGAKAFFESLSKSVKKTILQWVVLAKRPETRQKRINEIAALAAEAKKPKHL